MHPDGVQATFEPEIATKSSRLAPETEGTLKILSDPDTYVDRVRSRSHVLNTKTRRVQQEVCINHSQWCLAEWLPSTGAEPPLARSATTTTTTATTTTTTTTIT